MRKLELSGKKFNLLSVIKFAYVKNRKTYWHCICDCGNKKTVCGVYLRNGDVKSCGCLQKDKSRESNTVHGHNKRGKRTTEYEIWASMIRRCEDKNFQYYYLYGGKGIKVCDSWRKDFNHFLKDMGKRPSAKQSIDRIDPNGDYEPSNCRWATATQQSRNTNVQRNNTTGVSGVVYRKSSDNYQAYIHVDKKRIHLGSFKTIEEATISRKQAEITYWL